MSKVLTIGAHPDDIEIGSAGYIQKFSLRHILILSQGERGGFKEDRIDEAKKSAEILEADLHLYDLPDTRIEIVDAIKILEDLIQDIRPEFIITMSKTDSHQDHQIVHAATKIACRDSFSTVLTYISPSSAQTFRPNWFVSITEEEMKIKLKAISCHYSQRNRPYFAEKYILGTGRYWALITRSNAEYVEPYEVVKHWELS